MQKQIIAPTSKFFMPLLFALEIMGQPHRKACKLHFYWKICGILFQGPLTRVKKLKPPLFASGVLTSVCERPLRTDSVTCYSAWCP